MYCCRLATRGGMRPKTRMFRWREVARISLQQFGGDPDQILRLPSEEAAKALKRFPGIGDPGSHWLARTAKNDGAWHVPSNAPYAQICSSAR